MTKKIKKIIPLLGVSIVSISFVMAIMSASCDSQKAKELKDSKVKVKQNIENLLFINENEKLKAKDEIDKAKNIEDVLNIQTKNYETNNKRSTLEINVDAKIGLIYNDRRKEYKISKVDENNKPINSTGLVTLLNNKISDELTKFITKVKKDYDLNILTYKKSDTLDDSEKQFSNIPTEIILKLNGVDLKLRYAGFHWSFPKNAQDQDVFQFVDRNAKKILIKDDIKFKLLYNQKLVDGFRGSIILSNILEKEIDPTFASQVDNIIIDESKFKPTNVDWFAEDHPKNFFKGKIVEYADGDTMSVRLTEDKPYVFGSVNIQPGEVVKIRLKGIDTPEKAVGKKESNPGEHVFAEMSSQFAINLFNKPQYKDVLVGYADSVEGFGRVVADIFFGKDFKYSYSAEITRAGYTLPFGETGWKSAYNSPYTIENEVYPFIAEAMMEAVKNKDGFYHYFISPLNMQKNVYKIKTNSKWNIFYDYKYDNPVQVPSSKLLEDNSIWSVLNKTQS